MYWVTHDAERLAKLDLSGIATPAYIIDEAALEKNLKILAKVRQRTGCKILLAQKAFAAHATYPLIGKYLDGVCASGLNEARLGKEYFGGEIHVFAPGYNDRDFDKLLKLADHIIFNSFTQIERFKRKIAKSRKVEFGIRVNPEYSEIKVDLYNPAAKYSRLGVRFNELAGQDLSFLSGIHFHVLCEQNSDTLERVLKIFEKKFGQYISLPNIKWVNFGGGHHITRADYDLDRLVRLINDFRRKYGKQVILEPGEAVALNAGILVSSVLDIKRNEIDIAILDASASCHMPDTLEMPFRPVVAGADQPGNKHSYRLAGPTCLAGDVVGDYRFPRPLAVGDKLMFLDMAIYTMVKNTMFNGVSLPSIYLYMAGGGLKLVRKFGYRSFRNRLS